MVCRQYEINTPTEVFLPQNYEESVDKLVVLDVIVHRQVELQSLEE